MGRSTDSVGLSLVAAVAVGSLVLLSGVAARAGSEKSQISTRLDDTGTAPGAAGSVKVKFSEKKSGLDLKVSGLEPETEYEVEVEGMPQASFTTKKSGKASVKFRSNANAKQEPLDFDPRGKTLSISDGVDDVLDVSLDGDSLDDNSKLNEQTNIAVTSLAPGAEVKASYRLKNGRRDFKIEAHGLAAGSYDVFVGGLLRGVLVTSGAKGSGEVEFRDPVGDDASKLPLDFDPTGQEITVAQGANIFATGPFLAQIPSVNVCTESDTEVALVAQPGAPAGSGKAKLETGDDCKRAFEVELEDVPVGSYDLLVDGVLRGTIEVVTDAGGTRGKIEFEGLGSGSDEIEELPLDFDPSTSMIEIADSGDPTVLFSGNMANGTPPGPSACTEPPSEIRVALFNDGTADPDAKGDARYRVRDDCSVDFRVEIEKLPAGEYDLIVNGFNRGTIAVSLVNTDFQGEIEFRNPVESGKILLEFDPRGQLVEVRQGATTFLSRNFPASE